MIMDDVEQALRQAVIKTALDLNRQGINRGTSGNVSVRWRDGMLVTPSGVDYDTMKPDDIVFVNAKGRAFGRLKPSSEWRFHLDILTSRQEVNAVVHAHPDHCTGLAICRREIPAVHYMIAAAGGPTIRCADYETFGTATLSHSIRLALADRMACLIANHGLITLGATLKKALWLAGEVETLARQYVLSLRIGDPIILSDQEIERVKEKFKTYGPDAQGSSSNGAPRRGPIIALPRSGPEQ